MQRAFHIQVQDTEAAYKVERGRTRTSEHPDAIQNERDKISEYISKMVPRDTVLSEYLRQEKPHGDSPLYHLPSPEWDKTPKPMRNQILRGPENLEKKQDYSKQSETIWGVKTTVTPMVIGKLGAVSLQAGGVAPSDPRKN